MHLLKVISNRAVAVKNADPVLGTSARSNSCIWILCRHRKSLLAGDPGAFEELLFSSPVCCDLIACSEIAHQSCAPSSLSPLLPAPRKLVLSCAVAANTCKCNGSFSTFSHGVVVGSSPSGVFPWSDVKVGS